MWIAVMNWSSVALSSLSGVCGMSSLQLRSPPHPVLCFASCLETLGCPVTSLKVVFRTMITIPYIIFYQIILDVRYSLILIIIQISPMKIVLFGNFSFSFFFHFPQIRWQSLYSAQHIHCFTFSTEAFFSRKTTLKKY